MQNPDHITAPKWLRIAAWIGFASAILREWAWREKRGESLANLRPFADFVNSTENRDKQKKSPA